MTTRPQSPRLSIVVPTAGRSPHLEACLRALRSDAGPDAEILLTVAPQVAVEAVVAPVALLCDHVLDVPDGFAAANNAAFRIARGQYIACVNDDALVEPGWSEKLTGLLDRQQRVASVQGLVLRLGAQEVDGAGIGWNSWLQAVQLGHGDNIPTASSTNRSLGTPRPIFGVSATAAIFRRSALESLAEREGQDMGPVSASRPFGDGPFDPRLFAYYEDVDLALRLHAAGHQAWLVPEARARHVGSLTGRRLPWSGRALIHGNRLMVLARRLHGGDFIASLPRLLLRDLRDAARHVSAGELRTAAGVVAGWARALPRLPGRLFAPGGRLPVGQLHRFPSRLDEVLGV